MKKLVIIIVSVFMLSVCVNAALLMEEAEEDKYIAAMNMYNKKDFTKASEMLMKFMSEFPGSRYRPTVLLKLAELQEDYDKKKKIFGDVIEQYPNSEYDAEATYSLGRLLFVKKEYRAAEKQLGIMIGKYGETVWVEPAIYYLILSFMGQKKYGEAKTLYHDYSSNDKYYMYKSRINMAYANILYRTEEYKRAIPVFNDLIDNYDDREKYIFLPDIMKKLFECYVKAGDALKAEKMAGDLRLRFPDSQETKSVSALQAGDKDQNTNQSAAATPTPVRQVDVDEGSPEPTKETVIRAKKNIFTVQIGAFSSEVNAQKLVDKFSKKGYSIYIRKKGKLNLVQVGKFGTKLEASDFADDFAASEKVGSYFVKREKE